MADNKDRTGSDNLERAERIDPERVRFLSPEAKKTIHHLGAVVVVDEGKPKKTIGIMPGLYRNTIDGDPYSISNHLPVHLGDPTKRFTDGAELELAYPRLGYEAEVHTVDGAGKPIDVSYLFSKHDRTHQSRFDIKAEMGRDQFEIGTVEPARSIRELRTQMVDSIKLMQRIVNPRHMIYPGSTMPGHTPSRSDFSDHPYIQRIANDIIGAVSLVKFTGVGPQLHIEAPSALHAARATLQLENLLMPLKVLAQAAPFDGPDGHQVYGNDEQYAELGIERTTPLHDLRDVQRRVCLPSSGTVTPWNLPPIDALYNETKYLKWLDKQSRHRPVGRQFGGHTTRARVDLGPSGTIELPTFGTAGYRVERLDALMEVSAMVARGTMSLDPSQPAKNTELQKRFPAIYHPITSDKELLSLCETASRNEIEIARYGADAKLLGVDGVLCTVRQSLEQLYAYIHHCYGRHPSQKSRQEIKRGLNTAPNSLEKYYSQGVGTFNTALRGEIGIEIHEGALRALVVSAARAFKRYSDSLGRPNEQ